MKKSILILMLVMFLVSVSSFCVMAELYDDWNKLLIGESYKLPKETPLMPELDPTDPLAALAKIKYLPKGYIIGVRKIAMKRNNPWYYVGAISPDYKYSYSGWINSIALCPETLKRMPSLSRPKDCSFIAEKMTFYMKGGGKFVGRIIEKPKVPPETLPPTYAVETIDSSISKIPGGMIVAIDETQVNEVFITLIKTFLTEKCDGFLNVDIKVSSRRTCTINYKSTTSLVSTDKLVEQVIAIIVAYLEMAKRGWAIYELKVVANDITDNTIVTWHCQESWAQDYLNGNMSQEKLLKNVAKSTKRLPLSKK